MAWTIVETPNARYVLLFSAHKQITENVPEQFDALVLESGVLRPDEVIPNRQYKNVVKQAVEQGKPVWLTDAPPLPRSYIRSLIGKTAWFGSYILGLALLKSAKKEKISRRAFIKRGIGIGVLCAGGTYFGSNIARAHHKEIKHPEMWEATRKIDELIEGVGVLPARNILTAEKCESFLAPALQRQLGRKPTIAMVWGTTHYGIRTLLLHPKKRERLLQKYDLKKFVSPDYPISFQIKLKPDGSVGEIKEFSETLKREKLKPAQIKPAAISRRKFLATMFRRRRA